MKRMYILTITVLFCLMVSSCQFSRFFIKKDLSMSQLGLVAVLDLDNKTDYVNAGKIAADILQTELYACKFKLIPEHEINKTVTAENMKDLFKGRKISELGLLLNCEYIITGTVTEYRYKHGLGDDPAVGINLRMIKCSSGEVVWASSHSKSGGGLFLHQRSLNEVTQRVCKRMASELKIHLLK